MEARRYTVAAFVFPLFAVGPSLPPPTGLDPPRVETAADPVVEPEVQPPEEPCDDAAESGPTVL